jgi:hypothetical protein
MYKVLKDFNYSTNGIEIVSLKKGDNFDYESDSIKGLLQEGFLELVENIETKVVENIETKPLKVKKDKAD